MPALHLNLLLEQHTEGRKADRGHPVNQHVRIRLRHIRLNRGLLSEEVARRVGLPASSYSCLENGRYRISIDALLRILMVLDADVTDVFPRNDAELLAPLPVREVTYEDIRKAARHAGKRNRLGIAAELAASQRHLTMRGLAYAIGCHPSSLSHARRRLTERLPTSPGLRQQLQDAKQRLGAR